MSSFRHPVARSAVKGEAFTSGFFAPLPRKWEYGEVSRRWLKSIKQYKLMREYFREDRERIESELRFRYSIPTDEESTQEFHALFKEYFWRGLWFYIRLERDADEHSVAGFEAAITRVYCREQFERCRHDWNCVVRAIEETSGIDSNKVFGYTEGCRYKLMSDGHAVDEEGLAREQLVSAALF